MITKEQIIKATKKTKDETESESLIREIERDGINIAQKGEEVGRWGKVIGFDVDSGKYEFDSGKKIGFMRVDNQLR